MELTSRAFTIYIDRPRVLSRFTVMLAGHFVSSGNCPFAWWAEVAARRRARRYARLMDLGLTEQQAYDTLRGFKGYLDHIKPEQKSSGYRFAYFY